MGSVLVLDQLEKTYIILTSKDSATGKSHRCEMRDLINYEARQ